MIKNKNNDKREFSTETLIDVDYSPEEVGSYDMGHAPSPRHTQYAEELEDMVHFQSQAYGHEKKRQTHNSGVLEAVKNFDPEGDPHEVMENLGEEFEPRPLKPEDVDYEDIMNQFTTAPTKPNYWFEEFGDYWSCSCGHLNKGDTCTNCGLERELLRNLFILHKPSDKPGQYEGMPVVYEEVEIPKGRLTSKQKLIIAIIIILILLVLGGLFTYFYMIKPAMEEEEAKTAANTQNCVINGISNCTEITEDFIWNSYISAGDTKFQSKDYEDAIEYYGMAKAINNSDKLKDKILAAKYGYITANLSKGGDTFEKYLSELVEENYKDSKSIYNKYYAWKVQIVANLAPEDYSGDISTASRADTIYFHATLSGGPPKESIDVYYEAVWPDGHKETNVMGTSWKKSSRGYARFSYPIPIMAKEGKLTFKLYNKNTNELLGSDSITFKK